MNKKGITPIIAVVLLLMMTVAAAGAAFYWLTRMQSQAQAGVSGTQQKLLEQASSSAAILSQKYTSSTQNLTLDIQNTGGRTINDDNNTIFVLEDTDQNAVCSSDKIGDSSAKFYCQGCGSDISPGDVGTISIIIDKTDCDILTSGNTYYYQVIFSKGAKVSGSFTA